MPLYYIETFGCQMNVADSEMIADLLAVRGFTKHDVPAESDLVIVNTCSVREKAETRAKARLREHAAHKKKGGLLWVVGCMAENLGDALKKEIPGLDQVIGAPDIEFMAFTIDRYLNETFAISELSTNTPSSVSRFVPIMRGCDNFCSYCIVPHVRGREHSIAAGDVYAEIEKMAQNGVKEITLLGQNVNSYNDNNLNFPALLRHIHDIAGIERIRFTTSHPKDMSRELIEVVRDYPKMCSHIHLPVQSGSSAVLEKMNRGYTRTEYLDKIEIIKTLIPHADITTDVMTGFPGETDYDFSETLSLFKEVGYTTAFMFAYSVRKGTAAEAFTDQVPEEVKKSRLAELVALQTETTRAAYAAMRGGEGRVLITRKQEKKNGYLGQDFGFKRVLIESDEDLVGRIVPFRVTATTGMTMIGERIDV